MIRLDLKREPHWLDLGHGVRVHVRPCTTALMMAARAEAQRSVPLSANEAQAGAGERTAALVKALGRLAIEAWEGVAGEDGEPAPVAADNVDALLDLWPMAEAFERLYLGPALLLDEEKNAFAPAPNGTSAAGPGYCASCVALDRPCARGERYEPATGLDRWAIAVPTSSMSRERTPAGRRGMSSPAARAS